MKSLRRTLNRMFNRSPRADRRATSRLRVEALEPRQLMATLSLDSAGVLRLDATQVDINVAQAGTDTAGDIFELKYNGDFWKLTNATSTWSKIDTNVASINVDPEGDLAELKTNGVLWGFNAAGNSWTQITSLNPFIPVEPAAQVNMDNAGDIFFVDSQSFFWGYSLSKHILSPIATGVVNFQLGGTNNEQVYYQTTSGDIFDANNNNLDIGALLVGQGLSFEVNPTSGKPEYAVAGAGNSAFQDDGGLFVGVSNGTTNFLVEYNPATQSPDLRGVSLTAAIQDVVITKDKSVLYIAGFNTIGGSAGGPSYFLDSYSLPTGTFTPLFTQDQVVGSNSFTIGKLLVGSSGLGGSPNTAYLPVLEHSTTNITSSVINDTVFADVNPAEGAAGISTLDTNVYLLSAGSPLALAPNGNLFLLEASGTVKNFNAANPGGTILDTNVNQIAVSPNDTFFEVNSNNLWMNNGSSWSLLDTRVIQAAIGNNGAVYELNFRGNFWTLQAGVWTKIASNVQQFALAQDGQVAYLTDGDLFLNGASLATGTGLTPAGFHIATGVFSIGITSLDNLFGIEVPFPTFVTFMPV